MLTRVVLFILQLVKFHLVLIKFEMCIRDRLLTDSFLDYLLYERNYAEGTVKDYRSDILELQKCGEEMLGDLTPSDVDAELVREWIASLMDNGCASNTINRKLSSIQAHSFSSSSQPI